MDLRFRAEEDLRVIRSLMERATVYRAISAPTALVAGSLSILATVVTCWNNNAVSPVFGRTILGREFATIWVVVLVVVLAANTFFVCREARRTGRPFFSSGMRLALRAVTPFLVGPAAFTAWFYSTGYLGGNELNLVVIWIVFYGLALLSTALFAPCSLGWAFLISGVAVPVLINYAACTWPRKSRMSNEQLGVE